MGALGKVGERLAFFEREKRIVQVAFFAPVAQMKRLCASPVDTD